MAVPSAELRNLLHDYLRGLIASVCGIDPEKVKAGTPLLAFGLDSLSVTSIKHSIETDFGVQVTLSDLGPGATVANLAARLAERAGDAAVPQAGRSPWIPHEIELVGAPRGNVVALRLGGELDLAVLELALDTLAAGHPVLRVAVPAAGEESAPPAPVPIRAWLREIDATHLDDSQLATWLECAACEPFDDAGGPLLRIHLYRRAIAGTVVLVMAHPAAIDSWPVPALVRELEVLYAGHAAALAAPRPGPAGVPPDCVRLYRWVSGTRVSDQAAPGPDSFARLSGRG